MRNAAILTFAFAVLSGAIVYIPKINISSITDGLLDFVVMGRVPGTETFISYEAFFAGLIFAVWLIVTYNFTISCIAKIKKDLTTVLPISTIEEISL